ncbi:MAG: NUDIX domain-containing protein [Antricoccus sp.]
MASAVVGVAIIRRGQLLAAQRAYPAAEAGRWELPGGKCIAGESLAQSAEREIREELHCEIANIQELSGSSRIDDQYVLHVVTASLVHGTPSSTEHLGLRWVDPEYLDELDWLEPDRPHLPALKEIMLDGEPLPGGATGGATRVGETVRRPTGLWTPAVHDLLRYLKANRLAAPEVLGIDSRDREILRYIAGSTHEPDDDLLSEQQVGSIASQLKQFHDAVANYRPTGEVQWRYGRSELQADQIICHNDPGSYNWAFDGDDAVGLFDWDMAGPGDRLDDVAFAAWTAIPLYRDIVPNEVARRLIVFADSYRHYSPLHIFDASVLRMSTASDRIAAGQRQGDPGLLNLAKVGEPARTRARVRYAESHRDAIAARLHV